MAVALEDQVQALQDLERHTESLPLIATARAIYQNADPVAPLSIALSWLQEGAALIGTNDQDGAMLAFGAALDMYRAETGDESYEVGSIASNIGWIKVTHKD